MQLDPSRVKKKIYAHVQVPPLIAEGLSIFTPFLQAEPLNCIGFHTHEHARQPIRNTANKH